MLDLVLAEEGQYSWSPCIILNYLFVSLYSALGHCAKTIAFCDRFIAFRLNTTT
jgi:hypothetical protein